MSAQNEVLEIKDVKDPVDMPDYSFGIGLGIVCLLVATLLILFYKFRKPRVVSAALNPKENALRALEQLEKRQLTTQAHYADFYFELSFILRSYLEQQFKISALDMTSEEFLQSLSTIDHLNALQKDQLKNFLHKSDYIKFAQYIPTREEINESKAVIRSLIVETNELYL